MDETDPVLNKNWTLTNNSGTEILVIDAYSDNSVPVETLYEQGLKLLSTTDGKKTLSSGAAGTFTLDDHHKTKSGEDRYNTSYNIIIARADNLFPITSLAVIQDDDTLSFAATTVTAADADNTKQAEKFKRYISAFPTSNLAKDFASNISDVESGDVDAFFKGTKEYKNVDLTMVVAVSTYYSQFPYVWTDNSAAKEFYLYTSDGSENKYLGSVSLKNTASAPVTIDKTAPAFSCVYTPDDSSGDVTLHYSNGQFVDNVSSDSPDICLEGMFIQKSQLTKDSDDNTIVITLSGSIKGAEILGYDEKQPGDWSGLYILLHPKDAKGWLDLFSTMFGLLMGLEFLYKLAKGTIDGIRGLGKNPSKEDRDALDSRLKEVETSLKSLSQERLSRSYRGAVLPDDVYTAMLDAQKQLTDRLLEDNRSLINDLLDHQSKMLDVLEKLTNNNDLEDASDDIRDNKKSMKDAASEVLDTVIAKVKGIAKGTTKTLSDIASSISKKISKEARENNETMEEIIRQFEDRSDFEDDKHDEAEDGNFEDLT